MQIISLLLLFCVILATKLFKLNFFFIQKNTLIIYLFVVVNFHMVHLQTFLACKNTFSLTEYFEYYYDHIEEEKLCSNDTVLLHLS